MSKRTRWALEQLEAREVPSSGGLFAVGGPPSGLARLYNADGSLRFQVRPFNTTQPVTVKVAIGDLNADGTPDLITAADLAGGTRVKIYNGVDGSLVAGFAALPAAYVSHVSVASADFNGDGHADIVVAAGQQPRVKVFDGQTLAVIESFTIPPWGKGGVRLATGDVNGDGSPDLIVGHAVGAPRVAIYDGSQLLGSSNSSPSLLANFLPFASGAGRACR